MSEHQEKASNATVNDNDRDVVKDKDETAADALIKLTREQYSALLDRLAELEDAAYKSKVQKETYSLDDLVAEGTKRAPRKEIERKAEMPDLDEMSNSEIVKYIFDTVSQAGMELRQEIETLKIMREIDKCEAKYPDFWELEEDIRRIAMDNPSLSIETFSSLLIGTSAATRATLIGRASW